MGQVQVWEEGPGERGKKQQGLPKPEGMHQGHLPLPLYHINCLDGFEWSLKHSSSPQGTPCLGRSSA